ncbi:hypothetical protein, partial [Pseudomonas syringae group genomosp. 7]|uniref:hypothetical protein n=1 Tax=Pseudomonas syringae group genomosp. 7 TaxID=251699 RepID=UPI0037701B84
MKFLVINETQVDPEQPDRSFTQRQLVECLTTGADRFCWARRDPLPGKKLHVGRWIGIGMAS